MAQTLKDSVRTAILQAASQVFAEHPWAQATMQQVAKAAGISVGNLYHYFPGKLEILAAILTPGQVADLKAAVLVRLRHLAHAALDPALARDLPRDGSQVQTLAGFHRELLILFQDLTGTPWAGFPKAVRTELIGAFSDWMSSRGFRATPTWLNRMERLYEGLLHQAIFLFRQFEAGPVLERELQVLMAYHMAGMVGLSQEWDHD